MKVFGSRSGASLADVILMPVTRVTPTEGVTMKPAGAASLAKSRFRYFAVVPSTALATPSEPGLLDEEAIMGSPGWTTSLWAQVAAAHRKAAQAVRPLVRREHFIRIRFSSC